MLTKHVGPLGAQLFQCKPYNDRELVMYVTRICHVSQKWSYKRSCFIIYVLLDINMLQIQKKWPLSNQKKKKKKKKKKNGGNLDKIKICIAFVIY